MNTSAKERAGREAAKQVKDGMTVGLGTGSTAYWTLLELGVMVADGLQIRGVPTSRATEKIAAQAGIPLISFEDVTSIDLTIDGADEIDANGNLIKGGGGALLREKLIAVASSRYVIVADRSKCVQYLGAFSLPVEIVRFGWHLTKQRIEQLGCTAALRLTEQGVPFVTDNGNYILDCSFGSIRDPEPLHQQLKLQAGVIETGLFTGFQKCIIIGDDNGVEIRT